MQASQQSAEGDRTQQSGDGTRQLLQWGSSMVGTGLLAIILLVTVLGGYSRLGASTNSGWFALIVGLMCIPFGLMLLALGLAKWFRNRRTRQTAHSR
ncbi:MAG TPA: hypothetical protein VGG45_17325 [Terracidiphilus sp.]|jgi:hypothetical protein